jgi:hypothetical protein
LAADAARQAGSWDPETVGAAMRTAIFTGARGRVTVRGPGRLDQTLHLAQTDDSGFRVRASFG